MSREILLGGKMRFLMLIFKNKGYQGCNCHVGVMRITVSLAQLVKLERKDWGTQVFIFVTGHLLLCSKAPAWCGLM